MILSKVILERLLTLSQIFGFIIFRKLLLSVTLLMLRLPKRRPSLNTQNSYFRIKVKKY